jgi:hypothetical protein
MTPEVTYANAPFASCNGLLGWEVNSEAFLQIIRKFTFGNSLCHHLATCRPIRTPSVLRQSTVACSSHHVSFMTYFSSSTSHRLVTLMPFYLGRAFSSKTPDSPSDFTQIPHRNSVKHPRPTLTDAKGQISNNCTCLALPRL